MPFDRQLVTDRCRSVGASKRRRSGLLSSAESLVSIANRRPVDEVAYLDALLSAYLLNRESQAATIRAPQASRMSSDQTVEARFQLEPIEIGGRQGTSGDGKNKGSRVQFREFDAFAPLYLRDVLSRMTFADVTIVSIGFGCLRVIYQLAYPEASSQIDRKSMVEFSERFHVRSMKIGGTEIIGG